MMNLLLPSGSIDVVRRRAGGLACSVAVHGFIASLVLLPLRFLPALEPEQKASRTPGVFFAGPEVIAHAATADTELPNEARGRAERSTPRPHDSRIGVIDIDIARIRTRRDWLFPFLTTDLLFLQRAAQEVRESPTTLVSPMAPARRRGVPQLVIRDTELQRLVDRAWSRRERWTRFAEIADLVDRHDPNRGGVPKLLQTYLEQNLLQPYHDTTIRDPRFWAMLDCVADHVQFVDWVRSFARRYPSSRATTELLFLLDEFAQGSRDTLLMLLATDPRDLQYTAAANRPAFDLAISIRRHYSDWLARRQLESGPAIRGYYDRLRLRLLAAIVETTPGGYRAADARFLAGEILFNQNDTAAAVRMWRAIQPDPNDTYVAAYAEILREIRRPGGLRAAEVHRILGAEFRRWLNFSEARLRQFGYAFDTF